jgi:branched-chain amino acid aminotransferase
VSVFDRGFLYGDSVFETFRTYGGRPFALDEHLERLFDSASRVLIEIPLGIDALRHEVLRALEQSSNHESYLRMMITRGTGALGLDPKLARNPLRVLIVAPLVAPPLEDYQKGIKVIIFETSRVSDATPAAGAKVGNYLVAVLAAEKARQAGAKEALIASHDGEISEGATSNLFWFEEGILWTPPLEAGILAGITRSHLLKAAPELGLEVKLRVPRKSDLVASQGVFVSSSIREKLPVVQIEDDLIAEGKVPLLTRQLHDRFRMNACVQTLT